MAQVADNIQTLGNRSLKGLPINSLGTSVTNIVHLLSIQD